jgi:hypothetical protein
MAGQDVEMSATRPIATVIAPAPRVVIMLVVGIVLVGVAVAFFSEFLLALILYLPNVCIGALLVIRRPRNPLGWLLMAIAWAFVGGFVPVPATAESLQAGTASAVAMLVAWWSSWSWFIAFAMYFVIMVIFPAGKLPTGRWHRPAGVAIAVAMVSVVLVALAPTIDVHRWEGASDGSAPTFTIASPLSFLPDEPPWSWLTRSQPLAVAVVLSLLAGGVGSMVVRVRRAKGLEREQLRWMVAALTAVTVTLVLSVVLSAIFGDAVPGIALLPVVVAFALPAGATAVAVLRYRLYEIDRIVSRTIAYGLLTVILVTTYASAILVLQGPLRSVLGGDTISVALSTLVVAALFQPIRRRVQRAVDRRFDRARFDAERTAAAFAERLRDEVDIAAVVSDLDVTVQSSLKPAKIGLWLRKGTA